MFLPFLCLYFFSFVTGRSAINHEYMGGILLYTSATPFIISSTVDDYIPIQYITIQYSTLWYYFLSEMSA